MAALILNQESYGDPGHVGKALERRGLEWRLVYRETECWRKLRLNDCEVLVLLGSTWNPLDQTNPAVKAEVELVQRALESTIPVFGVCYGAQIVAMSAGATLYLLDEACFGFHRVDIAEAALPSGEQFFWNRVGFSAPAGSRVLAMGPYSCWAFECEGSLAVQFHPDATVEILTRWTAEGAEEIASFGRRGEDVIRAARRVDGTVERFCDDVLTRLLGSRSLMT